MTRTPRRCTPWRRSTPRFAARRIRRSAVSAPRCASTRKITTQRRVANAECAAERGRAVVLVLGDAAKAAPHFRDAWMKFRAVLEEAARGGEGNGGGKDPGAVADRLGVAYNAACAAHLAGEPDAAGVTRERVGVRGVYPGGHTGGRGSEGVTPEVLGGGSVRETQSKQSASTRGSSFGIRMRSRVVNPKKLVIRRRSTISVPPDRTARPDHAWLRSAEPPPRWWTLARARRT